MTLTTQRSLAAMQKTLVVAVNEQIRTMKQIWIHLCCGGICNDHSNYKIYCGVLFCANFHVHHISPGGQKNHIFQLFFNVNILR